MRTFTGRAWSISCTIVVPIFNHQQSSVPEHACIARQLDCPKTENPQPIGTCLACTVSQPGHTISLPAHYHRHSFPRLAWDLCPSSLIHAHAFTIGSAYACSRAELNCTVVKSSDAPCGGEIGCESADANGERMSAATGKKREKEKEKMVPRLMRRKRHPDVPPAMHEPVAFSVLNKSPAPGQRSGDPIPCPLFNRSTTPTRALRTIQTHD